VNVAIADIKRRQCGRKASGGVRYLFFFLPESVSEFGKRLCCPVVAAPVLKAGERFYLWRVEVDSYGLVETGRDSQHNVYYTQQVPFDFKGNRIEITNIGQMLRNKRIHVVLQDFDNELLLMKHAKLQYKREINTSRTGFRGYNYELTSSTRLPLAHVKNIPLRGVIDCAQNFENVDLRFVDTSSATVVSDDFGEVLRDDEGNVLTSDL